MEVFFNVRRWFKNNWLILIGVSLCIYFVYHAFAGERGIMRFVELKREVAEVSVLAKSVSAERAMWERRFKRLSAGSLDLDALDESARRILNLGKEGDYLIVDADN